MSSDIISLYLAGMEMLIRGFFFQILRLRFPKVLLLGRGARIYGFDKLSFISPLKIGSYSTIDARFSKGVTIEKNFTLGDFSIMRASGSRSFSSPGIRIGRNVSFGPYANIGGGFGLVMGDSIIAGPYCSIHPENHKYSTANIPIRDQGIEGIGINFDSDIWIGAKVTVLDGSAVGKGSILAAGSLIRSQFPPNAIIGGVPAKVIGLRDC